MCRRGVTSALRQYVPAFISGGRASNRPFQSTNCFLGRTMKPLPQFVGREAEAVKGKARMCKSEWPDKLTGESFASCVERKCTSQYRLFENLKRSTEKNVDIFLKPNLLVSRSSSDGGPYFTALSLGEDANLTPKYDIYPPFPPQSHFDFSSSCSGLFCFYDSESRIFLWNPTTNEFKILPPSQSFVEAGPGVTYEMITCEIWFDRGSQDYKVMRFFVVYFEDEDGNGLGFKFEFELYSLKTNSWKNISCPEFCFHEVPRACFNGLFYARAQRLDDLTRVVLSFDLSTGTISTLPLPDFPNLFKLLEYNGLLSILTFTICQIEQSCELWVWMNGSWTRESVFHTCGVKMPISFWGNGELLFLESLNRELVLFDRATGKLKHLCTASDAGRHIIPFYESFAQLKGGSDHLEEQAKEEDWTNDR